MRRLGLWVFGMGALLGGCSGNAGVDPLPDDVCATQHNETTSDGHDVVVCEALYPEAPFVHLPTLDSKRVFAGIVGTDYVTVDGAHYGAPTSDSEAKRHGVALYELELAGGSVKDAPPVLLFDESLFLAPLMGRSFEGTISRSMGTGSWAFTPSLPVRVDVAAAPVQPPADGASYEANVTLANLTGAVTSNDGSCMPSLASYGNEAPFAAGASVDLHLYRVPSMHNFGDDHLVISLSINGTPAGTLMGAWFLSPLDLVHGNLAPIDQYEGIGHGTPGTIPSITLDPAATSGGDACSP